MNIVVDARTMGSRPSGIGFYLFDFLKELINNDKMQITLLTDVAESEQMQWMQQNGIPIVFYGKRVFRSIGVYKYFYFINRYLKDNQPDLFWEPNNLLPVKMRGYNGKIVLTIHDLFPITNPEYFSSIYRGYFSVGTRKSVKMADALLFDSSEVKSLVLERIPGSRKKASFVSYVIISPLTEQTVSDDGYFLYIGNMEERKGTDILLKAYLAYRGRGGNKPLYLGGNIREKKISDLLNKVQQQCPDIHYLGYLTYKDKCQWLSKCSCFIFPSQAEGFGIPPLEAMCYEKPLITSNLSIFRETLQGQAKTFDITVSEEQQIKELSALMMDCPFSSNEDINYSPILDRYNARILSKKLEGFFQSLEEYCEDRI